MKRVGIGAPVSANAVPFSLSMQSSIGSPTVTALPASIPRNTRRRVHTLVEDFMVLSPAVSGPQNSSMTGGRQNLRLRRAIGQIAQRDCAQQLEHVVVTRREFLL